MYVISFNGIVDEQTKRKIQSLLNEKGKLDFVPFPTLYKDTELEEKLQYPNLSQLSFLGKEVLVGKIEKDTLESKLDFSQGSHLIQYIRDSQ